MKFEKINAEETQKVIEEVGSTIGKYGMLLEAFSALEPNESLKVTVADEKEAGSIRNSVRTYANKHDILWKSKFHNNVLYLIRVPLAPGQVNQSNV